MSTAWLDELLPRASLSRGSRISWTLFFALFPLAYAGGVMLQLAKERPARIENALDRAMSIRMAEKFALSKGFAVAEWHRYAIAEMHDDLLHYYSTAKGFDVAAARLAVPGREVQVLFRSPDFRQEVRVYLSLTGRVTGYDIAKTSEGKPFSKPFMVDVGTVHVNSSSSDTEHEQPGSEKRARPMPGPEAEAIARLALAENAPLSRLVQLGAAKTSPNASDPARTDLEWNVSPAGGKELTFHVKSSVRDGTVVTQRIEASVDKGYAKSSLVRKPKLPIFLNVVYGFFLAFAALYGMYRYARRTLQKEVSHARTLVVAGLFCVSYSALAYSLAADQIAVRVDSQSFTAVSIIAYITSLFTFVLMGLLLGIGYGSGEGEVREAYPGKLTSLDALLAGRVFSRDVAASFLSGAAVAGWLLL